MLTQSPHRKVQGLACYYLAQFLEYQASMVRLTKLFGPAEADAASSPLMKESWGHDYNARLLKMDPVVLEAEAARLYERVSREFADLDINRPADRALPGRPTDLGGAARIHSDELKRHSIGQAAPEIDGLDLDSKPMKLSDYRGKVVALFFCELRILKLPAPIVANVRDVAKQHASEPFALLGVATPSPFQTDANAKMDRATIKKSLESSGLPARFWFDPDQNGKSAAIQTAWNAHIGLYLIDHHGVIRYKHTIRRELLEKAVGTLLKELADEKAGAR